MQARKDNNKSIKGFFLSYDAPAPRRKFWWCQSNTEWILALLERSAGYLREWTKQRLLKKKKRKAKEVSVYSKGININTIGTCCIKDKHTERQLLQWDFNSI